MGAVLVSPQAKALHMVVIEPTGPKFLVRDPLPGVTYTVDPGWIDRFVAGGVFRP
jgi:hypothetical protein